MVFNKIDWLISAFDIVCSSVYKTVSDMHSSVKNVHFKDCIWGWVSWAFFALSFLH